MAGILSYHKDWVAGPQSSFEGFDGAPENVYAACSSPWVTPGNARGPITIQQMFDFARFLWRHDPTFQQGIKRVVGYFLTDLEFYDPTHQAALHAEDIASYRQVLEDRLNIKSFLSQILQNLCL